MATTEAPNFTPHIPYLPQSVAQVPKPVVEYARYMVEAPLEALSPARSDGVEKQAIEKSRRHRTRLQVGQTNRWRLPHNLRSDLLGISQASKSVQHDIKPFNSSYIRIRTAEGRHSFLNEDVNREFPTHHHQQSEDPIRIQSRSNSGFKPFSMSLPDASSKSRLSLSSSEPRLAKSAPVMARRQRQVDSSSVAMSSYIPERARPATTKDVFYYHSKQSRDHQGAPDVVLHCCEVDFELHSSVLKRSPILADLYKEAIEGELTDAVYYKNAANQPLDKLIKATGIYDNSEGDEYKAVEIVARDEARKDITHPAHVSQAKHAKIVQLNLSLPDNYVISKTGLAVALGNLYHNKYHVDEYDLSNVLVAADMLEFADLVYYCTDRMKKCIKYSNISPFYNAANRTGQSDLLETCVRWLELHLVPLMMHKIQLRDLPLSLLETALKSSRLFTYNEYSLYACLSLWLFLKINPQIQLMPTPTNVVTYFNSLSKNSSYLEREGQSYQPLFDCLRLHGITDTSHFENIRLMNILPQSSMVSLLSEHYSSLQSGGDMGLMRSFRMCAIRQGIVIEEEMPYHSEILSLHGFHFELKAVKTSDTYTFYMQRLKPTDTVLSFKQCERQTFSMRPDREVVYSITAQVFSKGEQHLHTTDVQSQRFGLTGKTMRSKILSVKDSAPPLFVTYAVLFPPS